MKDPHVKFGIYYTYGVWENPKVKVFNKPRHFTDQKHVNYLLWNPRVTQFILGMVFLMYLAPLQYLNHSRQESKQESKKHNLQLIFLTNLWPWNKAKVIKATMKMLTPSKIITMQSLNDLTVTVSEKKAKFVLFFKWGCQLSPLNLKKIVVYSQYTWRNQQSQKVST